jgi:hypothetical protein
MAARKRRIYLAGPLGFSEAGRFFQRVLTKRLSKQYKVVDPFKLTKKSKIALFFVMSRALAPAHWRTYYGAVALLLFVDSLWGFIAEKIHNSPIDSWIYLNFGFAIVVGAMLLAQKHIKPYLATIIGLVAVLIRISLDYFLAWNFYFPTV